MNTLEIIRNGLMQCIEKIDKLANSVVKISTLESKTSTLESKTSTLESKTSTLESKDGMFFKFISKNRDAVLLYNIDGKMCIYEDGIVEPTSDYLDYTLTGIAKKYKCHENTEKVKFVNFDTRNITDMSRMFYGCSNLTSLDVLNFNTESVTNMSAMFRDCINLASLDVSNFNTESVTNMGSMFFGLINLASLDVSNFNTESVTNMGFMFFSCRNIASLDVSNFDTSAVTYITEMFYNCSSLTSIIGTHTLEEVKAGTIKAMKGLKIGIDFKWSPNLERASILALFYGLAELTGQTSQTVTLHATAKARLTAEDIKIATDKNWDVQ